MGFERESFDKLMKVVWGKKSQMQQAMSRDSKGEPFIIRELEFKGAQTPSQLATALKVTSGRISTLLAALAGASYVAPYVNRVDAQGGDGIRMVQELQSLLEMHAPESKVLAASFKTPRQALDCLLAGCDAITLPLDVAQQMLGTPAVESAIEKFEQDWKNAFGNLNL